MASASALAPALLRLQRLLPGLWAGGLLCLAALATPSAFALLPAADAGRVAGRMLGVEAYASLLLGVLLLGLERLSARQAADSGAGPQFSLGLMLTGLALFCTVAGHFGLQPQMAAARAGQGPWTFGQLHAASAVFYGVKLLCVLALAWRAAAGPDAIRRPSS